MIANLYFIEDYENETAFRPKKTNPKQSQNKPNFRKAKMNVKSLAGKSGHTKERPHPIIYQKDCWRFGIVV